MHQRTVFTIQQCQDCIFPLINGDQVETPVLERERERKGERSETSLYRNFRSRPKRPTEVLGFEKEAFFFLFFFSLLVFFLDDALSHIEKLKISEQPRKILELYFRS